MQYLLTQAEYDELTARPQIDTKDLKTVILDLCTKVADHMPVTWTWGDGRYEPKPWGCMITASKNGEEWYCDECPVQKVCPAVKHWSQ